MGNWADLKFQQVPIAPVSQAEQPKARCSVMDIKTAIGKKNLPDTTIRWHFAKELEELTEEELVIAQAHIASLPKLSTFNLWQFKNFSNKEGVRCRILVGESKGKLGYVGKGDAQTCLYEVHILTKRASTPMPARTILTGYSLSQLELYPRENA